MNRSALAFLGLGLVACTSTRQLADLSDLRLRSPDHDAGFVVHTTEPWHERIDPNTRLRFHSKAAGWSDRLTGGDLFVDAGGAWIERQVELFELADVIRISGLSPEAEAQLLATRPAYARLERDGDGWLVSGQMLSGWLGAFETAVARLDPTVTLRDDDTLLYNMRIVHSAEALGTWRVYSKHQGWLPPVRGVALLALLDSGRATRVGWRWNDIDTIEVENVSGGKTLGAIVGTAALSVLLLPVSFALNGVGAGHGPHAAGARSAGNLVSHIGTSGGTKYEPSGSWDPEVAAAPNLRASPWFSTGSRVRAVVRPTLSLDTSLARRGELLGTGVIARLRFGDVFELGGGVRFLAVRDAMPAATGVALAEAAPPGWSHATTGVFQIGAHLPLDAGFRIAIPLGFEASAGGPIAHDVRVPWGVRYTSASGRWFGTVYPAMPTHLRLDREIHGHWSVTSSAELGVTF